METLKYKVITSDRQYDKYCKALEELAFTSPKTKSAKEEIALLTLLIEKYDEQHNTFKLADPVMLLKSLLKDHKMKAVDLAKLLHVSEGLVSDILNYKKGLSKETIRILADRFKMSQEAFNRPYDLQPGSSKMKNTRNRNAMKKLATV
ncbi:MAG: transcriptional regulator [Sediminibacterium sp.]|nr:transcriptional regulator [Sediminibacterium sp.]